MEAQLKSPSPATAALTIGSVSYLNAKPLIYGLDGPDNRDLKLVLDVPSKLGDGLRDKRFDVALLPVIDIQRIEGLNLLTSGGIGCDGPTLTVRIFSARPIEQIKTLACDPDSHTSVALARVILAEKYGIRPEFIELQGTKTQLCDARLLIGDKVVCEEPAGLEFQLDLGAAWKEMTSLLQLKPCILKGRDLQTGKIGTNLNWPSSRNLWPVHNPRFLAPLHTTVDVISTEPEL